VPFVAHTTHKDLEPMKTRKSHCLFTLARAHGIAIPTVPPIGQLAVGVLLTLAWLMAGMAWTLAAAVLVKREPRRKVVGGTMPQRACGTVPQAAAMSLLCQNGSEVGDDSSPTSPVVPATGSIETNPPTVEVVTIPAPIVEAMPAVADVDAGVSLAHTLPAAADVDVGCVDDVSLADIIPTVAEGTNADDLCSCRIALPLVPPAPDRKPRRRTASVAAHEVSRPQAAIDRSIAEAEQAIEEGKAWLAQRAAQKAEEKAELARMTVKRLRQIAARQGVKNTRTMRKDALLTLLAS
jgi:hypothetical protein